MQVITQELIDNAMSYYQYRSLIDSLLQEGKTTGTDHSEKLIGYTHMNIQRMNRWERTATMTEDTLKRIGNFTKEMIWLVLTEGWCGDASQILPIVNKMALLNEHVTLRFIFRDAHSEVMDQFLTNDTRSIPIIIFIEVETLRVMGHWGPRPIYPQSLMEQHKINPITPKENVLASIHGWYAKDKGVNLQKELLDKLANVTLSA